MPTDLTITEFTLPEAVGAPGWAELASICELLNAASRQTFGGSDLDQTPTQLLAALHDPYLLPRLLIARSGDALLGCALVTRERGHSTAAFGVTVHPDHRRRGAGGRLAEHALALARTEGVRVLHAGTDHRDLESQPRLASSNGAGSVPADDAGTRFASRFGFTLGQVERLTGLDLPVPDERLAALQATARPALDYEVLDWVGPVPDHLVDGVARMRTVASTAVPSGDLIAEREDWDPERIRSRDRRHQEAGNVLVTSAVLHRPSAELVGFSNLAYPAAADGRAVGQGYTLVLPDHRGHSLGLRLKINNLRALDALSHGAARVLTGNADENAAMLAINQALGFQVVAVHGRWERAIEV